MIENAVTHLDGPWPSAARPPAIEAKRERSRATAKRCSMRSWSCCGAPYADIGVSDIAAVAGLTTGAIYARFGDKRGVRAGSA